MSVLVLVLLESVLTTNAPAPAIALVGGTIINPGAAASRSIGTIHIEGGRITYVGSDAKAKVPSGAQVIDVRGKFIIPGLIDTHHHLGTGLFGATQQDPAKNLAELLSWGVTSVFNTGTSAQTFTTLKAATKNVREAKAAGVDAIKLVHDDMSWLRTEPMVVMQADVLRAIVDEAHAQGLKAYVHAPILRFAKEALRAGADGFVHGILSDPVDAEFIELMKKNRAFYSGTHVLFEACGDIAGWSRRLQEFDDGGRIPATAYEALRAPDAVARWEKTWTNTAYTKQHLPVLRANLKRVAEAGIRIATGTDSGVPGVVLGLASQIELLLHVEAGLSTAATLQAATSSAAEMIGAGNDLGVIGPGRHADLVVLDADPIADIRNVRRISRVVKAGIVR